MSFRNIFINKNGAIVLPKEQRQEFYNGCSIVVTVKYVVNEKGSVQARIEIFSHVKGLGNKITACLIKGYHRYTSSDWLDVGEVKMWVSTKLVEITEEWTKTKTRIKEAEQALKDEFIVFE